MNDRIDELIAQATRPRGPNKPAEFDKRYFAELIIEECARVARAVPCPYEDLEARDRLGHTWDMACAESGNTIAKHFGVK